MLKVVGASSEQTRLTWILLSVVLFVGFFAIFFYEMPQKHEDGMYSATVTWNQKIGFKVDFWGQNNEPLQVPSGAARAYYKPDIHTTGWASIEIETNSNYPDWVQAYAAGLLEGSLCWQLIYWHWQNTVEASCAANTETCARIREYLVGVEDDATKHAQKAETDEPFWHHVRLFYYQLDGLEDGWHIGVERSRKKKEFNIDHEDFLWLNSVNEIQDLKLKYNNSAYHTEKQYTSLSFLKYLPNTTHQFLLAHETGRSYSEMLRMHKKYTFHYHETAAEGSNMAAVSTITFTSYPGAIHSQDDYYQVYIDDSKRLTIAGSNMHVKNTVLQEGMHLDKVFVGPKAVAACRLSKSAEDWAEIVNRENGSRIAGKQWLVIETSSIALSVWMVEQIPTLVKKANLTSQLVEQGFLISAGTPYFEEVQFVLGNQTSDWNLQKAVEILELYNKNVTTADNLYTLLHEPELIALGRADYINPEPGFISRHGGIVDIKIADVSGDLLAVAGPLYSNEVSPFQWSRSMFQSLPHYGQPDLWKYGPVKPAWVW